MTTSDRKSVTVDIYGTSYKLVGNSSDYTRQVANYVDDRMRTISKAHSRLDTRALPSLPRYIWLKKLCRSWSIRTRPSR